MINCPYCNLVIALDISHGAEKVKIHLNKFHHELITKIHAGIGGDMLKWETGFIYDLEL